MQERSAILESARIPLAAGRTPLFALERIGEIFDADDPIEALRAFLLAEPAALEAIEVASPALADALRPWLGGERISGKAPLRALAYAARMSSRTTPFGICAGIGEVAFGEATTLEIDVDARRAVTRPDMELLGEVAKLLESGEGRGAVRYVANDAVFERGDRLYVTNIALTNFTQAGSGFASEQRPVSLKHTDSVRFVREIGAAPIAYDALVARIVERFSVEPGQATQFLDKLIEAGVLLSELRASPVGDPVTYVAGRMHELGGELGTGVHEAIDRAALLDAVPLHERAPGSFSAVSRAFSELLPEPPQHTVQVDLHSPFRGTLGPKVLADAELLGEYLLRLGAVPRMTAFRQRFLARYEGVDRLVPLLELVDPNVGLGVPDAPEFDEKKNPERDAMLLEIACDALRTGAVEVVPTERELQTLVPPLASHARPAALEAGFTIAAESREAIDRGDYLVVAPGFLGASGAARSLGRFMHVLGDGVLERAREIARADVEPDTIAAEVSYAPPNARNYNVSIRPRLFDDEIRLNVGGPELANRIALDDLWIGVEDDRFFLWSESRRSRVQPRESHVFATDRLAPNVCRLLSFLCDEGRWRIRPFSWGPAAGFSYLPRVRVGRIVLAPRQWRLKREALGKSVAEAASALERWRSSWNVPRYVLLCEADNTLLVDLDSRIAADLVADQAGEAAFVEFTESLTTPSHAWLPGDRGRHAVEFAVSLQPRRAPQPERRAAAPVIVRERRRHGPGSSWVYAKLYAGAQATDDFLLRRIAPVLQELRAAYGVDRWFFVRYGDPDTHLRLRLRTGTAPAAGARERLGTVVEEWLERGVISRCAFDTYDPEYERYGGPESIDEVERFFTADSDLCLGVLDGLADSTDARVSASVESFHPWLAHDDLAELAIETFERLARRKLAAQDRAELRRLGAASHSFGPQLAQALRGEHRSQRLASLFHMHCNRLGLHGEGEERAAALLRSVLIARRARGRAIAP